MPTMEGFPIDCAQSHHQAECLLRRHSAPSRAEAFAGKSCAFEGAIKVRYINP